jgi:hypothetical protein
MAVQKQEEPAIRVDQSRKYPTTAGQCDKCGYFKTWAFKIVNPKTGKQVPGHVTRDGFKINDGDCPFYALLARKAEGKAAPAPQMADGARYAEPAAPAPAPVTIQARAPAPAAPRQPLALTVEIRGGEIVASIGACSTTLTRVDAACLAKALIDMVTSP